MKIYTKTGDKGSTSLFGGKRVPKNNIRIEAYGTVDELNASLGVIISENVSNTVKESLKKIQNDLFVLGGDLATPLEETKVKIPRTTESMVLILEKEIDLYDSKLEALKSFILPGGIKASALLHLSRTICRRAERRVIELSEEEQINKEIVKYLNRLSDLLFIFARFENSVNDIPDVEWEVI